MESKLYSDLKALFKKVETKIDLPLFSFENATISAISILKSIKA